ncbi:MULTISPECIES: hypothetical protein [unclassified Cupriavidus]|uniref:hypothetical protein n=1 Tax=Cupriavidus sp. H19C3 TaxID=3241603 RepID=UPI0011D61020|nr:MAG: hypothetical protein E6Q40_08135 [Cupriavidus sp.]
MKYVDGTEVRVGDRVLLGAEAPGVVVCSMETGEYSAGHPEAQWGYLIRGVMIEFPKYGLIHYLEMESDIVFIARGTLAPP